LALGLLLASCTTPVGCAPLALARVMHYHQFPSTNNWNWTNIPNTGATQDTYALFNNIHSNLSNICTISYSITETGIPTTVNLADFLSTYYSYTHAQRSNYSSYSSYLTIYDELYLYQRPVILTGCSTDGKAHTWVCDGIHDYQTCVELDDGSYLVYGHLYFHHAWGLESINDTWLGYAVSSFVVNGYDLSESIKLDHHLY
jgi:hypothetical protein